MGGTTETCDVYVEICGDTPNAICVDGGPPSIWIPRSQIDPDESELDREACTMGDRGYITIPQWLAEVKSLV